MYDNITPEQWIYGLVAILIAFSIMAWLFFRYTPPRDMSTPAQQPAAAAETPLVHVPGLSTGSSAGAGEGGAGETQGALADTDALEGGTGVQLSLRLSDAETIALLAAQRGPDGKHRYSANQIHALIGGSRAAVLNQVKALRDGAPAEFKPLTPEQRQVREQLQLGER